MRKLIIIIIGIVILPNFILAQKPLSKKEVRKQKTSFLISGKPWTAELPLWIPGFAGSFAYGDVDIEGEDGVDPVNPIEPPNNNIIGEILSRLFQQDWYLRYFFLTRITYEKDNILLLFDAFSGSVGSSVKFITSDNNLASAKFRTTNFRALCGYKFLESTTKNKKFRYELFGYLGARVFIQAIDSEFNNSIQIADINPSWADPLIGIQNQFTFRRWQFILQGDYGGFFVNTNYSNQFAFSTSFRTGKLTSLKLGWNHLHLFRKGSFKGEEYRVKVTLSGPSIAIAFHF